MTTRSFVLACLFPTAVLANNCTRAVPAPPPRQAVRVVYYAGNGLLSEHLTQEYAHRLPAADVQLVREPTVFSTSVIDALESGRGDVGFALADSAYFAYVRPGAKAHKRQIQGISLLQVIPLHLIIRQGADIKRISDLKGHDVRVGPQIEPTMAAVDTMLISGLVLAAFGVAPEAIHAQPLVITDASDRLKAGKLDAVFFNAAYPAQQVANMMGGAASLLPIEGAPVARLSSEYPFIHAVKIPAGTYPRQTTPLQTVGVNLVLLCRSDLPEQLVYDLTKQFFLAISNLSAVDPSLRTMNIEEAPATPVPLHEGAARYYRERELSR